MRSFSNDFLRITKPVTKDGINLLYVDQKPIFKVFEAPAAAKNSFERRNKALPDHLKLKIEIVKGDAVQRPLPAVPEPGTITVTADTLDKMIAEAVAKALKPAPPSQNDTVVKPPKPGKVEAKTTANEPA